MRKIHSLIDTLSAEELIDLKRKVELGEVSFAIRRKLERFKNRNAVCPICNSSVGDESLTLIFGPSDMRQKASFDGQDCLEYFLRNVRK